MNRITKVCVGVLILSGCKAHMLETQGENLQLLGQRPVKGGVIRYLNTGPSSWERKRRADAEKQMHAFCAGKHTIVTEGPRSQFGADMPIGKSASFEMDQYTYVKFECAK